MVRLETLPEEVQERVLASLQALEEELSWPDELVTEAPHDRS